jgi:hypothetical protein
VIPTVPISPLTYSKRNFFKIRLDQYVVLEYLYLDIFMAWAIFNARKRCLHTFREPLYSRELSDGVGDGLGEHGDGGDGTCVWIYDLGDTLREPPRALATPLNFPDMLTP